MTIFSRLPRAGEAVLPDEKFTRYFLNPSADFDKARAFKSALGYGLENYEELKAVIIDGLEKFPAKCKRTTEYGTLYEVRMDLKGANGKVAKVITAWIDDAQTGEMRLVSAYVDK